MLEETKHLSTRSAELLGAAGGRIKEALPGVAEDAKDLLGRSSAWVREKAPELATNAGTDAANAGEDTGAWLWRQVSLRHKGSTKLSLALSSSRPQSRGARKPTSLKKRARRVRRRLLVMVLERGRQIADWRPDRGLADEERGGGRRSNGGGKWQIPQADYGG